MILLNVSSLLQTLGVLVGGWIVYGPENGYNFPYPRISRVMTSRAG